MEEIKQKIRIYIAENLIFSSNGYPYTDEASFLEEGIVDSMGIMELVAFIEDEFKISILDQEITPDNFDSIDKLGVFVSGKQNGKQ